MGGISGRIHSWDSFGTLDGPGIRFVVFLQGCPLRCRFCHNPDTWHPNGGRSITTAELEKQIESCRNFLRNGGVTLSGGGTADAAGILHRSAAALPEGGLSYGAGHGGLPAAGHVAGNDRRGGSSAARSQGAGSGTLPRTHRSGQPKRTCHARITANGPEKRSGSVMFCCRTSRSAWTVWPRSPPI